MEPPLTEALGETLALFEETGVPQTTTEAADRLDLGRRSTYERLDRLVECGRLETKKVGANGRVWWRPSGAVGADRNTREEKGETMFGSLEAVDIGVIVLDESGEVARVNAAIERYFGVDGENVLGRSSRRLLAECIAPRIAEPKRFLEAASADGGRSIECRLAAGTENESRWLERRSGPIESGAYAGGRIELYSDITERKRRERELERDRKRLQALFDETPDAITIHGPEGEILDANERSIDIFGYSREELLSMNLTEVDVELDEEEIRGYRAEMEKRAIKAERELEREDGSTFPAEVSVSKIGDGEPRYLAISRDITDRKETERRLERQRERLVRINHLNDMIYDVTDAVIRQSTREEIERTVCAALAGVEPYESAWIGGIDGTSQTITVRTEAGGKGPSDGDTEVEPGGGDGEAIERAIGTGSMRVTNDDGDDHDENHGECAVASIPLYHDETAYGVLNVRSARSSAFGEHERAMLTQLGEIVSQAIAAAERKRALVSEEFLELEFYVPGVLEKLGIEATDGRIVHDYVVSVSERAHLVYGTATHDAREMLEALCDRYENWNSVRVLSEGDGGIRFQIRADELSLRSSVASEGGSIDEIRFENGDLYLRIRAPTNVDAGSIIEAIRGRYPNVRFLAKRQLPRARESATPTSQSLSEKLTDRQRTALDTAYHQGYFEWPREASGTEIADSIGIARSTFSQHLRKAEKAVFDSIYSSNLPG